MIRPPTCKVDRRSPDERCMGTFPSRLQDMEIGWRLDARDTKGDWFPATVVEVGLASHCCTRSCLSPAALSLGLPLRRWRYIFYVLGPTGSFQASQSGSTEEMCCSPRRTYCTKFRVLHSLGFPMLAAV